MAASIRLQRRGQKKQPYYRVVVIDSSSGSSAGYIEKLGTYDPEAADEDDEIDLDEQSALEWMRRGAMPSETVRDLFNRIGLMETLREVGTSGEG